MRADVAALLLSSELEEAEAQRAVSRAGLDEAAGEEADVDATGVVDADVASWPLGCCKAMTATTSTTRPRTASSTPIICSFRLRRGDSGNVGVMQAD